MANDIVEHLEEHPCTLLDLLELGIDHPLRVRARDALRYASHKRAHDDADRALAFVKKHTPVKCKKNVEELGRGATIIKMVSE